MSLIGRENRTISFLFLCTLLSRVMHFVYSRGVKNDRNFKTKDMFVLMI